MHILVIGGTRFVGRHFVQSAQARGHSLTLFHRGKSNPDLFPDVETIQGDRESELGKLAGQHWDAVVDTCGYVPRLTRLSAEALRDSVGRYLFISTISVYAMPIGAPNGDETSALQSLEDVTTEAITGETYGGLKVLCEQSVEHVFGERSLMVRPGMIVGAHDPTDRFTYWVDRVARGGDILLPAQAERAVQMIDARDLGDWMVLALERNLSGAYNATGQRHTWADWMQTMAQALGTNPTWHWVDDAFVEAHQLALPFYTPAELNDIFTLSIERALENGLQLRSLADTTLATRAWDATRGERTLTQGISAEREAELVAAWRATS